MRPAAILMLATLALPAGAKDKPEHWLEVRSPHFVVNCNGSEKQARKVADQFERIRAVFQKAFPNLKVDPSAPIIVLAAKDEKSFNALTPLEWRQKGQMMRTGLFLRGPEKNYVLLRLNAEGDDPYHVLYHEYTHLLVNESIQVVPLWLDEGFAEFYGNSVIEDKEVLLGKPSENDIVFLRQNKLLPLAALFAVDHSSPYYNEEHKGSVFYAESWALTHYLMLGALQSGKNPLQEFVALLSHNVDAPSAERRAFGDLKDLQNKLEDYVRQNQFKYELLKGSTGVDEDTFSVRELSPADAAAVRGDFLIYNRRAEDGRALLLDALHEDPSNAQAAESMGFLEFREGHGAESKQWLAQAVKLNSKSYLANYYFAALTLQESATGPEAAQIETSLRAAIQINPRFAPAYDALASYYNMRGERLEDARMLELQAVELEPNNIRYRIDNGNIMLRMKRGDDAVRIARLALSMARTPEDAAMAQSFLDLAQKYQDYLTSVQQNSERREAEEKEARANGELVEAVREGKLPGQQTANDEPGAPPRLRHRDAPTAAGQTEGSSDAPEAESRPNPHWGPQDTADGKIVEVKCGSPAIMDLKLAASGRSLHLHSENYFNIAYSAVNFKPEGELLPCSQLQGMQARIRFYDVEGEAYVGEMISVQLSK